MSDRVSATPARNEMAGLTQQVSELAAKLRVQEGGFVVLNAEEAALCAQALDGCHLADLVKTC